MRTVVDAWTYFPWMIRQASSATAQQHYIECISCSSVVLDVGMICSMVDTGMDQGQLQTALQDKARLQTTVQKLQVQVQCLDSSELA